MRHLTKRSKNEDINNLKWLFENKFYYDHIVFMISSREKKFKLYDVITRK
jgi:hypothetical protein